MKSYESLRKCHRSSDKQLKDRSEPTHPSKQAIESYSRSIHCAFRLCIDCPRMRFAERDVQQGLLEHLDADVSQAETPRAYRLSPVVDPPQVLEEPGLHQTQHQPMKRARSSNP